MSRHRNVRTMNYDDEYDDDDDYPYGHSVEDECISPTDASQWIYDRAKGQQSMSAFLANNRDIEEEDDDELEAERAASKGHHQRRDSECYQLPDLGDEDRTRLVSCMDEIRNIVGEVVSDRHLVEAIMKHGYDFNLALDEVLNSSKTPPVGRSGRIAGAGGMAAPKVSDQTPPMEKDFKLPNLSSLSTNGSTSAFKLPSVRFAAPANVSTNLSDLVKSRLRKQGSDSAKSSEEEEGYSDDANDDDGSEISSVGLVPKLSDLSLASDSGMASSSPAESNFSNLAELARFHLQAKGSTPMGSPLKSTAGGFTVPNIFNKSSKGPPPGFSTKPKVKDTRALGRQDWIIDLKSALIKDKSEVATRRKADAQKDQENEEPIHYGFIDCDIVESRPIIDEFCTIDSSSIMNDELANLTSDCSGLGQVLCLRYRKRVQHRVRHGFVSRPHGLKAFGFDVPSPDDVILGHMSKFRRQ